MRLKADVRGRVVRRSQCGSSPAETQSGSPGVQALVPEGKPIARGGANARGASLVALENIKGM